MGWGSMILCLLCTQVRRRIEGMIIILWSRARYIVVLIYITIYFTSIIINISSYYYHHATFFDIDIAIGAKLAGIFSHPAPYPASSWMKKIQLDARRAGHPAGAGGPKIANPGFFPPQVIRSTQHSLFILSIIPTLASLPLPSSR